MSTTDGYELSLSDVTKVFFRLNQKTSGNTFRVNSSISYPTNGTTWIHVAATYDGTTIRIYIDGVPDGSVAGPPSIGTNNNPLYLGREDNTTPYWYQGKMDEVRIYNRALTLSEIQALATPVAPTLISPADMATGIALTPALSWNASTTATSYRTQVSSASDFLSTVYDQSGIAATSASITPALSNNTLYYWRVNASNASGTSSWSDVWSFTTITATPPAAPSNLVVTPVSGSILQLNWTDNSTNETGFEIERSTTGSGGLFTLLTTLGADVITYNNTDLTPSTNYCYRVRATNAAGSSDYSNTDCETTPATLSLQDGLNGYAGTRDTYTDNTAGQLSTIRGGEAEMIQDIDPADPDERRSLLLFDLSSVPAGALVQSAELQMYVNFEGQGFNMHRMLVPWDEATVTYASLGNRHFAADGTDAEISVNASWPGVDTYVGFITVSVPASTIQDWIDGLLTNNGWLMIASHPDDGQRERTHEWTTIEERPKLTVQYYPPVVPTISITNTPLNPFSSELGMLSAEQSYTVSGINLTADIEIAAPADFEISTTSGTNFGSTATLPQSGGNVSATTIYVRLNGSTPGISSGNITHTSSGAAMQNVAVTGTTAALATRTFQDGVNGYTGTKDTHIYEINPTTPLGNLDYFKWDTESSGGYMYGLLRFDDIFGTGAGQIPLNYYIQSAILTYTVSNVGDYANVYEAAVDWTEDVTYNDFGGDAGVQSDEYGALVTNAPGTALTSYQVDVKSSLISWHANPSANKGWLFYPTASDGVNVSSSEFATIVNRPKLTVVYGPYPPDPPVLVAPDDHATGVSTSPTLQVSVSDPES